MVFPYTEGRGTGMRKLAWICSAFVAMIFLSEYLFSAGCLLWIAVECGVAAFIAGFLPIRKRAVWVLILIGFTLGAFRCWIHSEKVLLPANELDGKEQRITARVVEYPDVYDTAEYVVVHLYGDYAGIKCRLTSYDGGIAALKPGDEIQVEVQLRSAQYRYGEQTDRYSSKGVFLLGICQNPPVIIGRWGYDFLYFPGELNRYVVNSCRNAFSEDTAPFMAALLTGDKTDLYEDELLNARLSAAGLTHVVAVSGMHISFLMGMLTLFCSNRRRLALIAVPMLFVFCAMVGFTPSVCRAAFMQSYLLLANVVDRENDTPTSLAVIMAVLLLKNPSAAASVGLQLSFAATAGIMLLSGRIHRWVYSKCKDRIHPVMWQRKALAVISGNIAMTLGALVFTLPLTAIHFGSISIVSPISNLLSMIVVSILFVGGYAVIAVGAIVPLLGGVIAGVLDWLVRYIFLITDVVNAFPFPVVYMGNRVFVVWLIAGYVIFAAAYVLRDVKRGFRPALPLCFVIILLCVSNFMVDWIRKDGLLLTALDVGQGQCIVLENQTHTVVVDCGSSSSEENIGHLASRHLHSRGHERLDVLVLTHGHFDHVNGASRLLASVEVGLLVLPIDVESTDKEIEELLTVAKRRGTDVYWLREDADIALGDMTLRLWAFDGKESDYEKGLGVMASQNGFEALILGDMQSYAEWLLSAGGMPDAEVLVVSHHGSKSSTSEYLLEAAKPDVAIISVGHNSYGHPHEEVLQRLSAHNIEVHRTDMEGNIMVRGG